MGAAGEQPNSALQISDGSERLAALDEALRLAGAEGDRATEWRASGCCRFYQYQCQDFLQRPPETLEELRETLSQLECGAHESRVAGDACLRLSDGLDPGEEADQLIERSLAHYGGERHAFLRAHAWRKRARLALSRNLSDQALAYADTGLATLKEVAEPWSPLEEAALLQTRGDVLEELGRLPDAVLALEASLTIWIAYGRGGASRVADKIRQRLLGIRKARA